MSNTDKWALITGADGGMGTEITRAVAHAGFRVIMACYDPRKGQSVCDILAAETGNSHLEVWPLDLASLTCVSAFADKVKEKGIRLSLLMNNAGTMETGYRVTEDGLERTVSVNYVGPYLLTRKLVPVMEKGARIVNMVSCTYVIGRLDFPDFFTRGQKGGFWRIPIYSNTKLALLLFTISLADKLRDKGITVNAADPGIVSTNMITMHAWFDPLTDVLFRPFIRTPLQGADTAIGLLLHDDVSLETGGLFLSGRRKLLSDKYVHHRLKDELWNRTENWVKKFIN